VLGMREWEHVDFELIGALFLSGAAYGDRDGALATGLFTKVTYNFRARPLPRSTPRRVTRGCPG